jgi:hypothetical protein
MAIATLADRLKVSLDELRMALPLPPPPDEPVGAIQPAATDLSGVAPGGLASNGICMLLLIARAAAHRIAFAGDDDPRFHTIGTILVSVALLPLGADVLSATRYTGC